VKHMLDQENRFFAKQKEKKWGHLDTRSCESGYAHPHERKKLPRGAENSPVSIDILELFYQRLFYQLTAEHASDEDFEDRSTVCNINRAAR